MKLQNGGWFALSTLDLAHAHFNNLEGVYIIWKANGPVVRVGQGIFRNRLGEHRNTREITAHAPLHVTWAPVAAAYRDGVERYLGNTLRPLVGSAFPNVAPITVALPWPWS